MYRCENCSKVFSGSPIVSYTFRKVEDDECDNEKRIRFDRRIGKYVEYFKQTVEWKEPETEVKICPVCYAEKQGKPVPEVQSYCACIPGNLVPSSRLEQDEILVTGGFSCSIGFGKLNGPVAKKLTEIGAKAPAISRKNDVPMMIPNPCLTCEKRDKKSNGAAIHMVPMGQGHHVGTIRDGWSQELMFIDKGVRNKISEIKDLKRSIVEKEINIEVETGKLRPLSEKDMREEINARMPSDDDLMLQYVPYKTLLRFAELKCFLGLEDNWALRNLLTKSFNISRVDLDGEEVYCWTKISAEEYEQWRKWYYYGVKLSKSGEKIKKFDQTVDEDVSPIDRYNMKQWKRFYKTRKEDLYAKTWDYRAKTWQDEGEEDYKKPRKQYRRYYQEDEE